MKKIFFEINTIRKTFYCLGKNILLTGIADLMIYTQN